MGGLVSTLHPADVLPHTAAGHFRLWLLRSTLALIERATCVAGSLDVLLERQPVLRSYVDEAARSGLDGLTLPDAIAQLDERLGRFAGDAGEHLPLERLGRALGLGAQELSCFLLCGLSDEDPRARPARR